MSTFDDVLGIMHENRTSEAVEVVVQDNAVVLDFQTETHDVELTIEQPEKMVNF